MSQAKAVFLLPVLDTNGRDLIPAIIETRDQVYLHFKGWTFDGLVEGAFQMSDGSPAFDQCRRYVVSLEEERIAELERLLLDFKGKTKQERIYLEIQHNVDIRFL